MPVESVSQRVQQLATHSDREQLLVLLGNLAQYLDALTAKLDADAGVTDTNYRAQLAQFIKL